ncbi:hypothetical protein RND71_036656 [Anisodus tanguticus]|uniref:WRKY domain-containing protein n=1 Tax=Anisodus tanguticus TaxID=243964 RepID=A0AAE1R4J3_9SOLA|nr:hypothetical protein RND71_036656 [Anisodus tanguticus]
MVPQSPRTIRKRLIEEQLVQGKEFTVQLQTLLANHKSVSAHDLILKILTSFTEALSELTVSGSKKAPESDSLIGSKDSGGDLRTKDKQVVQDRRGCHGKRRCSYKYDQKCGATKQVQRIKEDPIIYRITYFGHHICKSCALREPLHQITSEEDSKLQLDWQDFMLSSHIMADDFSLEGVVSSMTSFDLHGLDMVDISKFGDFHFEALEFS